MNEWIYSIYLDNSRYLIPVLVLTLTFLVAKFTKRLLERKFSKRSNHLNIDHTQFVLLKHTFTPLIYLIGIGIAIQFIPSLKTVSISLLASAGVIAVVVGFAAQKTFSNVITGIFIVFFKPFRVGDLIRFQDKEGFVEDISLRHTVIRNFNNKRYVVPNSIISDEVIENSNIEDEKICEFIDMSISYDSDVDKAMKIMEKQIMKHPYFYDIRSQDDKDAKVPAVQVKINDYGDSSVNLRAWAWAKDPIAAYHLRWDSYKSIKKEFDKKGIEIPFPYRTIVYKE